MRQRIIAILIYGFIFVLLSGCASPAVTALPPSPTATRRGALTLYRTLTPSATPTLSPTTQSSPTPLPSPTSTPRIHRVARGEDLISIALRYRVSLDALLAANPGINPRAMSIGLELKIPAPTAAPPGFQAGTPFQPTPTPAALEVGQAACYSQPEGSLLCLLPVRNTQSNPVENITAAVRLADENGSNLRQKTAFLPLNLLQPGSSLALAVIFEPPVPTRWQVGGELLTAYPLLEMGDRYLNAQAHINTFSLASDGLSAQVSGSVQLEEGDIPANLVWVVVAAYNESGDLVGYQRWESTQPLPAGQKLDFSTQVFSLGGKIARIESLVEARP